MCNTPECGGYCRAMRRHANRFAESVTLGFGLALIFAHWAGFLQGVVTVFIAAGALAIGIVAGYVYIRFIRPARRLAALGIPAATRTAAIRSAGSRLPAIRQAESAPAELPQGGGQHLHIHLGAGADMEQVSRIIRGGQ